MNERELKEHIKDQDKEIFDLIAKTIELINLVGWDADDNYTFNDGEQWSRFDPDYESALARAGDSNE